MKRFSIDVAAGLPAAQLDQLAKTERVEVFSLTAQRYVGHAVRFRRQGAEVWADLELDDDAPLPNGTHAESVVCMGQGRARLLAIALTTLPRGMVGAAFQGKSLPEALQAAKRFQADHDPGLS